MGTGTWAGRRGGDATETSNALHFPHIPGTVFRFDPVNPALDGRLLSREARKSSEITGKRLCTANILEEYHACPLRCTSTLGHTLGSKLPSGDGDIAQERGIHDHRTSRTRIENSQVAKFGDPGKHPARQPRLPWTITWAPGLEAEISHTGQER